jgi:biotin operon repressor
MSTADKWADPRAVGGGTVQSKQAERSELARQMAEFEKRQGPVKETPIIVRDSKPNRI